MIKTLRRNDVTDTTYQEVDGTCYSMNTPDNVIKICEFSRLTKTRLHFTFGDESGKVWESATPERGHVGRSTGIYKIPLLIRTKRSHGGEALMDDHILKIQESRGGRVLYERKP